MHEHRPARRASVSSGTSGGRRALVGVRRRRSDASSLPRRRPEAFPHDVGGDLGHVATGPSTGRGADKDREGDGHPRPRRRGALHEAPTRADRQRPGRAVRRTSRRPGRRAGARAKFVALGGVLLSTGGLALVSMAFAVHMALGVWWPFALLVGLGWGFVVVNLDRMLLVGMAHDSSLKRNLVLAVPRVGLALILGVVIATPLTMQVFGKEIDTEIVTMQAEAGDAYRASLADDARFAHLPELESRIAVPRRSSPAGSGRRRPRGGARRGDRPPGRPRPGGGAARALEAAVRARRHLRHRRGRHGDGVRRGARRRRRAGGGRGVGAVGAGRRGGCGVGCRGAQRVAGRLVAGDRPGRADPADRGAGPAAGLVRRDQRGRRRAADAAGGAGPARRSERHAGGGGSSYSRCCS